MANEVRAALVGAGLVGQVAHLQTLTMPGSPIRLAAVVDASAERARQIGERYGVPHGTALEFVDSKELDAVIISAPDPAHESLVTAALGRNLHVFVEKPLGLSEAECARMTALANSSGRICQVGYMKRFDPVVDVLARHMDERSSRITGIGVEVRDADAAPFVVGFPFVPVGNDVPAEIIMAGSQHFDNVVQEILGRVPSVAEARAYGSYTSSIIHDLNLVRLLVRRPMSVETGFFAMDGLQVGLHLRTDDGVLMRLTHTQDTSIADYEERFTIYTTEGLYEMVFPAPYLLNKPTQLRFIDLKDEAEISTVVDLNQSTEEAFVRELRAFAESIQVGARQPQRNDFVDATEDIRLLTDAMRMAASSS